MATDSNPGLGLGQLSPGWLLPAAGGLALARSLVLVAQAGLLAWILAETAVSGADPERLIPALGLLILVMLARSGLEGLGETMAAKASRRVRQDLRADLFDAIRAAGPSGHTSAAGSLAGQLMEQVDKLDGYYARYLPSVVAAVVVPLVVIGVAFSLDWLAAALMLAAAPLIPAFMILVGLGADQISRQQSRSFNRLAGFFLDRLQGLPVIRFHGAREWLINQTRKATDEYRRRSMSVLRVAFLSSAVLEFFSAVAIASVAIYIGLGLLGSVTFGPAPELTLFTGLFVLLLAPEFFQPLRQMAQHYHDRADALGAVGALQPLLKPLRTVGPQPREMSASPDFSGPVAMLLDVSAGYPDRGRVLGPISLEIQAGQRLVICGPSGCGKSTLLGLLAGFIRPAHGRVRVGGLEPAGLEEANLARCVSWVGQTPLLFAGSLEDNIRMGNPEADESRLRAAMEIAGVEEFVHRLPHGLATRVSERGQNFSGGQVQRVALARAVLSPAPLMLLDEPTASLDPGGERQVLEALGRVAESGKTLVLATHQPAGLEWAHRIIELSSSGLPQGVEG